eukprot:11312379-Alexandrium_andersonii.AAC.1
MFRRKRKSKVLPDPFFKATPWWRPRPTTSIPSCELFQKVQICLGGIALTAQSEQLPSGILVPW